MKMLVLSRYGNLGASSRLRLFQYLPFLSEAGIECVVESFIDDVMLAGKYETGGYSVSGLAAAYGKRIFQMTQRRRFDLLWIEKEALPWIPAPVERLLLKGVPYVMDFDDAVFHNYDLHRSGLARRLFGDRIDILMEGARLITAGNDYLADRARAAGSQWVELLPTVIDLQRYIIKPSDDDTDIPRIVWIGSPSTARYLKLIHSPLVELSRRYAFRLRIIGPRPELPGIDVEYVDWSEATEVSAIRACHIGVMPLPDTRWARGKCGYKLIQYMACGLPVVGSPVGVNSVIIREGENGFLADSDRAWFDALEALLKDSSLRRRLGCAGRRRVEEEYCIQKTAPLLLRMLKSVGRR
jgi:glycosyltransferase involved in cell wall biosynthesis